MFAPLPFFGYPFRVKVGITNNLDGRKANVAKTSRIWVWRVPAIPSINAKPVEQWAHRILSPLHAPLSGGSGRTEWFWNCPIVSGLTCLYYFGFSSIWPYVAIALVPIDIALFVLCLSFIDFVWCMSKWVILIAVVCLIFVSWKGINGL